MGLDSLKDGITGAVQSNSTAITAGAAGLVGGAVLGASVVALSRRKKTKRRKSSTRTRSHRKSKKGSRKSKRSSRQRGHSSRKIKFTKNGQPYITLKNGKARFISKRSAKTRKSRKGGYY